MEINRAAELLRALADGIDPMTGQPLPDESVYNRPEIIRALHCVLQELQERADSTAAVNAGRNWRTEEGTAAAGIRHGASDRDDCAPPRAERRRD